MNLNIRLLSPEDYPRLYKLWTSTPGMGLNSVDDSPEGILRYLRRNPTSCFAAEAGDQIVGAILAGHDGRRGFLYHLAVAEPYRLQGLGRSLVRHALAALQGQGIRKTALVAFRDNRPGNEFWKSLGFTLREDLNYWNLPLDE